MQNKTYIDITEHQIDPQDAINFVTTPKHGAIDLFVGMVRSHNLGKQVLGITYEVFKPLAMTVLREITSAARHQYGNQLNIYITHFNGHLDINGISVVIAVSSPHRDEAFSSTHFIIEELKHHTPIWKQEHYIDGDSNWVKGHSLCSDSKQRSQKTLEQPIFNAAVLIGGKSSRMGQNKALLKLNGEYLINKTINMLHNMKASSIILSGALEGYATLPDLITECGPMSGICTVLLNNQTIGKIWLFLPIDMPLITQETLLLLLNSISNHDAACFSGHVFPLAIQTSSNTMYHINAIQNKLQARSNIAVKQFIASLHTNFVPINEKIKIELNNFNTQDAWREIQYGSEN